jgi:hypothetical protein
LIFSINNDEKVLFMIFPSSFFFLFQCCLAYYRRSKALRQILLLISPPEVIKAAQHQRYCWQFQRFQNSLLPHIEDDEEEEEARNRSLVDTYFLWKGQHTLTWRLVVPLRVPRRHIMTTKR